jgi:hypothetical protein
LYRVLLSPVAASRIARSPVFCGSDSRVPKPFDDELPTTGPEYSSNRSVRAGSSAVTASLLAIGLSVSMAPPYLPAAAEQQYLYVASAGTRNYVEYGGVGILVFDIGHGWITMSLNGRFAYSPTGEVIDVATMKR